MLLERINVLQSVNDIESKAIKKVLMGMKRNELSRYTVSRNFAKEEEDEQGMA